MCDHHRLCLLFWWWRTSAGKQIASVLPRGRPSRLTIHDTRPSVWRSNIHSIPQGVEGLYGAAHEVVG